MADKDRIVRLERDLERIKQQIDGLPVRLGDASGGGAEKNRLIRGQSVGAQSGVTIQIDNVIELSGGLDPSGGNPATAITVFNTDGASYADNDAIQAIYSPGVSGAVDWETVITTGSAGYRAVRGLVKGIVTADESTFVIDGVTPLAGGLDPVSGNAATELTIFNSQLEAFADNTPITAIYDGVNPWRTIIVERYRLIMAETTSTVSSGTASFSVDAIEVLASGLDPRVNPASAGETITVYNEHADSYANGDKLIAAYNVATHHWEALPKTSLVSATLSLAVVYSTISAATLSGSDIDPGTGVIKKFTRPATPGNNWVFVDSEVTAWNIYFDSFPTDCIVWVDSENYVVSAGCTLMP